MAQIGNTPQQSTILQLEQRKSYTLMLRFMDTNQRLADLTGCAVRLVMKSVPLPEEDTGDSQNLIVNSAATITDALLGECQFDLQATDLDVPSAEYPFAIVLVTPDGYSILAVKGVVAVQENTEWSSLDSTYSGGLGGPVGLEIRLRGVNVLDVISSAYVPPGFTWMSEADKEKVDGLSLAGNLLPAGGLPLQVMAKNSAADYDFRWINLQAYDGTLDATGQANGKVPTADGTGEWNWALPRIDWAAASGQVGYIFNKPPLGTAAAADTTAFAAASHNHSASNITSGTLNNARVPTVTGLRGISSGTTAPSGGVSGDIYLRYV